jgi:hypothetical protein
MGASFGGAATLAYGPQLRGLDGVIDLSGELRPGHFHGWDFLDEAPYRGRARALVLARLRR